jgi:prepilin-type N-terminal cleavage/methylation domain-containing protein
MMSGPPHRSLPSPAFSLIELLVVVAIIGAMAVLLVPAFNSIGKSQLLNAEGNKIVNLINLAGQNSAAKNAMTALIAIKGSSTNAVAFGLFEYVPEGTGWKQVSKWEPLKDGIVAYYNNPDYKFTDYPAAKPPIQDFPALTYRGAPASAFQYLIFLPSRSLLQSTSAQFQLAEGFATAGGLAFTRPATGGGKPANFYTVTVLATSGYPKIDRP